MNDRKNLTLRVVEIAARARPKRCAVVLLADKDGWSYQWTATPGDSLDACFEAWSTDSEVIFHARVVSSWRRKTALLIDAGRVKMLGVPRGCSVVDGCVDR